MNGKRNFGTGGYLWLAALMAVPVWATENLTLTFVPLGPTTVNGTDMVSFEITISTGASSQIFRATQLDLPCSLPGGASGTISVVPGPAGATADPDGDGLQGPGSGGVAYLFGPNGLAPYSPAPCIQVGTPMIGVQTVTMPANSTRFLTRFFYNVSDCAGGNFNAFFQCTDQPGGMCPNPPISGNTTRLLAPDGPDPGTADDLVPFKPDLQVYEVPTAQCCDGQMCLGDQNSFCCTTVNGADFHAGDSCAADPCPCFSNADCDNGLFCDGTETCVGSVCQPGTPVACPPLTPNCSEDLNMCVFCDGNEDCVDSVFCNGNETCDLGTGLCVPGNNLPAGTACNDPSNTDCTDPDTCNGFGSCVANHAPSGSPCEDGLFCTIGSTCAGGLCTGGVPLDCNDNLACTADSCNETNNVCDNNLVAGFCLIDDPPPGNPVCYADGFTNPANNCEACLVNKSIVDWSAKADGTICDDEGNDCTGDECLAGICVHPFLPIDTPCDDGDPCTGTGQPGIGVDTCDGAGNCSGMLDPECNDDCATAVVAVEGKTPGNNENAADDDGEASCQPNSNHDVWFKYTATCTGLVQVKTAGSVFAPSNDTVLSVYDACGGNELACDDDGGVGLLSALTFNSVEGVMYWIRVAGYGDNVGDISLTITTINDCVIDDVCYAEGDPNPMNPCEQCIPSLSASDWSPALKGTACGSSADTECDSPDSCDGMGGCEVNHKPDGSACTADPFECTLDFCLTGVCTHPSRPSGTPCGSGADTECDNPDTCDGGTTCLTNYEAVFTPCGDPTNTDCDNPDTCDGAGTCLLNLESDGTECTEDGNDCKDDICEAGVCAHPNFPVDTPCGSASNTNCDNPDTCNGFGICQINNEPDGMPCDEGDACTAGDACASGVCVGTPVPQMPTVIAVSSRTLRVTAQPPGSAIPIALRVTSPDYPCLLKWVQPDGSLGIVPFFQLPSIWGTLDVSDIDIVPSSEYHVQAECGMFLSAPGIDTTWMWGDIDNDGDVDSDDIQFVLEGFVGNFANAPLVAMDIEPCETNGLIDVDDIISVLNAFMSFPYPCPVPCM